ncbi:protein farnesyltransferase subunit beta [Coccinella septempunctata]|uniref:protein farnesyltransferase subunit beta n=1 Tax=Coccinella septempunctata TaxID=41139 RepID=UPI001D090C2A|nr:protein farnesyltransferase subunit beta [Coccinella septempunctata]
MPHIFSCRNLEFLKSLRFKDEDIQTLTSVEQKGVEEEVFIKYSLFHNPTNNSSSIPDLIRHKHAFFLNNTLRRVSRGYEALDASRTWICYWVLHSLSLLDIKISDKVKTACIKFLAKCQNSEGGFGGGPGQISHLAPTYAAVNALIIIGTKEAYDVINREKLLDFLWSLKQENGSFCMHVDGEIDIRGVYCALSVAELTNTSSNELFDKTAEWIISCQTYEGGFGGCPDMEAHGGYAFCGLAALTILKKQHLCDIPALLRWLVHRQMRFEGGFQGRTNKLVDGCYSFWQGAALAIINMFIDKPPKNYLFDNKALQEYILICAQHANGGLIDKPGKHRDEYHSCYVLSGLSIAQHLIPNVEILGTLKNEVKITHPVHNIRLDLCNKAIMYYSAKGSQF